MRRVLQVVGGMNRAGAETMLMNAYRTIDRNRLQFDYIVYDEKKQDYEDEIAALGGRVFRVRHSRGLRCVHEIREVIREFGPYEAVHAHTLHNSAFALVAAWIEGGTRRIAHSHNTANKTSLGLKVRIYEIVTILIIRMLAQDWLACGIEAGTYLFGPRFRKKGVVVNNGIDVSRFSEQSGHCEAIIAELGLGDRLVIGSIARLSPVKNHKLMLDIAETMREKRTPFKLLLVGDGELRDELERSVKARGLSEEVLLLGMRDDVPDLLKVFDVFLMPSLFEGNPVALIEAQASGLPCVVSEEFAKRADLGLGLIRGCSLGASSEEWCRQILLASSEGRCDDLDTIARTFREARYDVESTAEILTAIYEGGSDAIRHGS